MAADESGAPRDEDVLTAGLMHAAESSASIRASSPDGARPQRGTGWTKPFAVQPIAASFQFRRRRKAMMHATCAGTTIGRVLQPSPHSREAVILMSLCASVLHYTQPQMNVNNFRQDCRKRQDSVCIRKSRCAGTGWSRLTVARISSSTSTPASCAILCS